LDSVTTKYPHPCGLLQNACLTLECLALLLPWRHQERTLPAATGRNNKNKVSVAAPQQSQSRKVKRSENGMTRGPLRVKLMTARRQFHGFAGVAKRHEDY